MEHRVGGDTAYTSYVGQETREVVPDEVPVVDHEAVRDTVRLHRARRKARTAHKRRTRRAGIRFWVVFVALVVASIALSVIVWQEIQRLFGL